jgi:hypothetical protein
MMRKNMCAEILTGCNSTANPYMDLLLNWCLKQPHPKIAMQMIKQGGENGKPPR